MCVLVICRQFVRMGGPNLDVTDLWQAHRNRKFPARLRGAEVGDVDVVLLDACIAGCVSTWLSNGGHLDLKRSQALASFLEDLEQVLAVLDDAEGVEYLQRLRDLAVAVLARIRP